MKRTRDIGYIYYNEELEKTDYIASIIYVIINKRNLVMSHLIDVQYALLCDIEEVKCHEQKH